jgi:hypothetical protein
MSSNRYGLDADYYRKNLQKLADEVDDYTPYGMYMALTRLADIVQEEATKCGPEQQIRRKAS